MGVKDEQSKVQHINMSCDDDTNTLCDHEYTVSQLLNAQFLDANYPEFGEDFHELLRDANEVSMPPLETIPNCFPVTNTSPTPIPRCPSIERITKNHRGGVTFGLLTRFESTLLFLFAAEVLMQCRNFKPYSSRIWINLTAGTVVLQQQQHGVRYWMSFVFHTAESVVTGFRYRWRMRAWMLSSFCDLIVLSFTVETVVQQIRSRGHKEWEITNNARMMFFSFLFAI
jgi:hypothetical protein